MKRGSRGRERAGGRGSWGQIGEGSSRRLHVFQRALQFPNIMEAGAVERVKGAASMKATRAACTGEAARRPIAPLLLDVGWKVRPQESRLSTAYRSTRRAFGEVSPPSPSPAPPPPSHSLTHQKGDAQGEHHRLRVLHIEARPRGHPVGPLEAARAAA